MKDFVEGFLLGTLAGGLGWMLVFAFSQPTQADPYITYGTSFNQSDEKAGGIGYRFDNNYDIGYITIGMDKWNGETHNPEIFYVSKLFKDQEVFGRLGIAKVNKSTLVGPYNFIFGVGVDLGPIEAEFMHFSSGGVYETNSGIDLFMFNAMF